MPGIPCVVVFKLNSLIIERFPSGFKFSTVIENTAARFFIVAFDDDITSACFLHFYIKYLYSTNLKIIQFNSMRRFNMS